MSTKTGSMTPSLARELLTMTERYTAKSRYKLAIQNLSNAYRLACPSTKSADDFDNRILKLRKQHNSEEDIYAECIGILADCVCCADWLDC